MNLYNGRGEYVGRIEQDGNGQTAYGSDGGFMGFQNDNGTFDDAGGKVGSPGLLGSLFNND